MSSTTDRIHERARELGTTGFVADLTEWEQARRLAERPTALNL